MSFVPQTAVVAVAAALSCSHVKSASALFHPGDGYYYAGGFHVSDDFTFPGSFSKIGILDEQQPTKIDVLDEQQPKTGINHYTTIGMPHMGYGIKEFIEGFRAILADKTNCHEIGVPNVDDSSHYVLYPSESGAQLWGETHSRDTGHHFGGFVPHFKGKSRERVCLLSKHNKPHEFDDGTTSDVVLDGGFSAVFDTPDGEAMDFLTEESLEQGGIALHKMVVQTDGGIVCAGLGFMNPATKQGFFTFDFDCPNFGFFGKDTSLPTPCTVQLSAFAREIRTYGSVEEYYDATKDEDDSPDEETRAATNTNLASQFFGSRDFGEEQDKFGYACIVGHVVQTEMKTNELTGKSFYWALLRTLGGIEIDIVIHPRLLDVSDANPPQVGGVIQGYFWLSGLLLLGDEEDEAKSG